MPSDNDTIKQIEGLYSNIKREDLIGPGTSESPGRLALILLSIPKEEVKKAVGWSLSVEGRSSSSLESTAVPLTSSAKSYSVKGVLKIPSYSVYNLLVEGVENSRISIDGKVFLIPEKGIQLELAEGNHLIDWKFTSKLGAESASLRWKTDAMADFELIPEKYLFKEFTYEGGLLGKYILGEDFSGPIQFSKIDPQIAIYFHNIPLIRPFSIKWSGTLQVPVSGEYEIGTIAIDRSSVTIDGKEVLNNPIYKEYKFNRINLTAGTHSIEVFYTSITDYSQIYLMWRRPDEEGTAYPIPSKYFRPSN